MALLEKDRTKATRKRLQALEKELGQRFDIRELEKRIDLRELERRLPRRQEEDDASAAGFVAGLLVGAILGVVLTVLFGKAGNRESMDQFVQRAGELKDTASEKYHQARGEVAPEPTSPFGDESAIEREIDGEDVVSSATDTIDSASDDIHQAVDDAQERGEAAQDNA